MSGVRLTAAQALVRAMAAQMTELGGETLPLFAGVWAIFGHGNVAALGEALHGVRDRLPTYRGQNEQTMALAAIAFAKASRRRRMMAATSSIGPGAMNMVTAAAVAHVNRLPLLLLPGDVFASRRPDPVLQQVEDFGDGTVSANDCFRPVSRYFDRITRPEQVVPAFDRALSVLTDPAECGPVTLALCQDVQAQAYDYPASMFEQRLWRARRPRPDTRELADAVALLRAAQRPLVIAGGGVLYSEAEDALAAFCVAHGLPLAETMGGKSSLPAAHVSNLGGLGVTGTAAANALAVEADVILAVGTRLQDFTTGSWALFQSPRRRIIGLNVQPFDAGKHRAASLVCDAREGIAALDAALAGWRAPAAWSARGAEEKRRWLATAARYTDAGNAVPPSDAQVIGAVQRASRPEDVILCAAGGLPGELHKLWQAARPGGFHAEYGFSTMGYEVAGGLGAALALPHRYVTVLLGDGAYLMANSELASAVMLGVSMTVVLLDNRGFACIDRLQRATGGAGFNNLFADAHHAAALPAIDFAAHARSLGAQGRHLGGIAELEAALAQARTEGGVQVLVLDTDPRAITDAGGHWWDVAVPEVSVRPQVAEAHARYVEQAVLQHVGD